MKFCPQCGTSLEPGSRFCQECGCDTTTFEVTKPEASSEVIKPVENNIPETANHEEAIPALPRACPQCNSLMGEDERFCQECGFDTSGVKPMETATIQASQPVLVADVEKPAEIIENEEIPSPEVKQFCSSCGASMIAGDVFCQECGYNTATTEPVPQLILQPSQPEIAAEAATQVTPAEKEPVPVAEVRQFCPDCGASMVTGDVYCQECGSGNVAQAEIPVVTVPEKQPAKSEPVVAVPPAPPVEKQTSENYAVTPANQASAPPAGKKKGLLVILLGILALAVIGAGSWFAYDKFIKKTNLPVVDSTSIAIQQEPVAVAEPEINDTANLSLKTEVENPVSEPPKTVSNKQNTPKKTTPKKQTPDPKKNEPARNEPLKNDEPVKVKIKPVESKTGRVILSIINDKEVKSGPLFATKLKLDGPFIITKITTFHYNWGKGAQPGTISLQKRKDTYGPWQARGIAGDDGTPNGKWVCEPKVRLEEGTYKVEVSDEKSWSYNGQSSQKGFVVIEGYEAD